MEELTKSEERIMRILWRLKKGFVKDIIEALEDNIKPPYNTISSIVRLLGKKRYVGYKSYGKTYEYFPIVTKLEYRKFYFKKIFSHYFDNSIENLVSYIIKEEEISEKELKLIEEIIKENTQK